MNKGSDRMLSCLRKRPQIKWILITVVLSIMLYDCLEEEDAEIIGELLALAGGVLIIMGLEAGEEAL
ncbi:MAG: hypothetical protein ACRDDX_13155 [Cellulosilyticaceae bacterium]